MRIVKIFTLQVIALLFAWQASGQYIINPLPHSPAFLRPNDILNLTVVNASNDEPDAYVICEVKDAATQSVLYSLKTELFILSRGLNTLNGSTGIQTSAYYDNHLNETWEKANRLPVGKYLICYTLYQYEVQELASKCVDYEVAYLQPPRLIYPTDKSVVQVKNPVLSWLAPIPSSGNDNLRYELRLAEILSGQSGQEALLANPSLLFQDDLTATSLVYPSIGKPLEEGKSYSWQVKAYAGEVFAGATEIWQFKVQEHNVVSDSMPVIKDYAIVKDRLDGGWYRAEGLLPFAFDGEYTHGQLAYKIHNDAGKDVTPKNFMLRQQRGSNRYLLDLRHRSGLNHGSFYVLTVVGPKGDKHYLRFLFIDPAKN